MKRGIALVLIAASLSGCAPLIVPAAAIATSAVVGNQIVNRYPNLVTQLQVQP